MSSLALKVAIRITTFTVVLAVAGLAACGDNGAPNGSTVLIIAAQGGTVSMDGDETGISIPANALAADTEIAISYGSLSEFGALDDGLSRVLVMEPVGTTLQTPATVLVEPGISIGANKVVSVRQWVDGGWYGTREASVVSGGLVSTTVSFLAPLAIVVEDQIAGPKGTISGSVLDLCTEQPLEGITFELLDGSTVVDTAVSGADGVFSFTEVPVGSYVVHADVSSEDNYYNDPTEKDAVVTEDQTTEVFFGFASGPC